jgi:hypothetical protein
MRMRILLLSLPFAAALMGSIVSFVAPSLGLRPPSPKGRGAGGEGVGADERLPSKINDVTAPSLSVSPAETGRTKDERSGVVRLFNGQNLDGWSTYLEGEGKNNDPEKVFQVHDGIIHIYKDAEEGTKMPFGYIATEREYADYQLRLEYQWGKKRFAPRAQDKRDSGLLYHVTGSDKVWPRSVELQIQEGDTGDIFTVYTRVTSTLDSKSLVSDTPNQWAGSRFLELADGGVERSQGGDWIARIVKSGMHEVEGWNTIEAVVKADSAVHIVNGKINNRCWNILQPDPQDPSKFIPLKSGRIILQAEGAEVFYRNIELTPLK